MIKHNVKSQQIHGQVRLLSLTSPVEVLELWLNAEKSFVDDLLHLLPDVVGSFAVHFAFGS